MLSGARAAYDGKPVLFGVDLTVRAGERVALLERSGAGKSTLPGLIHAQARSRVALIPQAAALVRTLSVFHNVYRGRLDRRSTLHNLRTLAFPARTDLAEVHGILGRSGSPTRSGPRPAPCRAGSSSASPWRAPSTTDARS